MTNTHEKQVTMTEAPDNTLSGQQDSGRQQEHTVAPRASVYETAEAVILELEMPGVASDSVDIRVENDELTITGRRMMPVDEGYDMLHQERLPFSYKRAFILSDRIDTTKIAAACENGVLKLTMPKSAKAQPHKINID